MFSGRFMLQHTGPGFDAATANSRATRHREERCGAPCLLTRRAFCHVSAVHHFIRRFLLRAKDRLRFHPAAKSLGAASQSLRGRLSGRAGAKLEAWCAAARSAATEEGMLAEERRIEAMLARMSPDELWALAPRERERVDVKKAAILKPWRGGGEKGALIVSFESQWVNLLALGRERLGRLLAQYEPIVAPTWSPPHHPVNYLFPRLAGVPVWTTISNDRDLAIFPRFHANYRPVPLLASSWVNAKLYAPRPAAERDVDLVMVANFGTYKRHHVLFRALANGGAPSLKKIVLIGQPQDARTAEVLLGEADLFGVRDRLELRSRISDGELVATLCRARAAFIASLREGSCVAVIEAMMAGTPVGLLRGAAIGSSRHLNEDTGRWLDEGRLADDLESLVAEHASFRPRERLLEDGVECGASTRALAAAMGVELWTHHWRPDPLLLDEANVAEARAEAERIGREFGLQLVSPQLLPA
jgi:glycosyltransferase involved in cell wall biosynthesis